MTNNDFNKLLYQVACEIAEIEWRNVMIYPETEKSHKLYTLDDLTKVKQEIYIRTYHLDSVPTVEHNLYSIKKNGEVSIHIDTYKCSYMVGMAFEVARRFELLARPKSAKRAKFGINESGVRIAKLPSVLIEMTEKDDVAPINDIAHTAPKIKPEDAAPVVIPKHNSYTDMAYRRYKWAKAHAPEDTVVLVYSDNTIYMFEDSVKTFEEDFKLLEKKRKQKIERHFPEHTAIYGDKRVQYIYRRYWCISEDSIFVDCFVNAQRKYVLYDGGFLYDFSNLVRHYKANKIGDLERREREAREASYITDVGVTSETKTEQKDVGAYLFLFFFDETAEQEAA